MGGVLGDSSASSTEHRGSDRISVGGEAADVVGMPARSGFKGVGH
jgi:hypothetical protein